MRVFWLSAALVLSVFGCKPKPDPVCQAARARLAECPKSAADKWDQSGLDICVHDVRKASNADVLDACNKMTSCDEARTCITTTLNAAAKK